MRALMMPRYYAGGRGEAIMVSRAGVLLLFIGGACFALIFGVPMAVGAAPPNDIRAYCASVHQSYQIQLVCFREETAARNRLYSGRGRFFGIPAEIWDYCGRVHRSWTIMEVCVTEEQAAKQQLGR